MTTQRQERQINKQQAVKLPHWLRPIFIAVGLLFFAIGTIVWLWNIWGQLSDIMSASFIIATAVCAFLALPFIYPSRETKPPEKMPTSQISSLPPISITVSPNISMSPNQTSSLNSPSYEHIASYSMVASQPIVSIQKQSEEIGVSNRVDTTVKIKSLPEQEKKTELPDPNIVFLFNEQLSDPGEFYGRAGERATLLGRARNGASTSIVGPRRIGKTWLMNYLIHVPPTKPNKGFRISYLDATTPSCSTEAGFTKRVLEELGVITSINDNINWDLALLERVVKDLKSSNQIPILCIDEFEGLCRQQGFSLDFLERLRGISQIGLGLVVASKRPLVDVVIEIVGEGGKTSPFFNVFEQLTLRPFGIEEAEKFVQEKSIQAGFNELERRYLLEYGQIDGQQWPPLRLQLVGKMLLNDKNLGIIEGLYNYRPENLNYWRDFGKRLEEKYEAVVKR